jgi:general secretion pathway protein L
MLPQGGGGGSNAFLRAANRVSAALAPLAPAIAVRTMRFEGGALTVELDAAEPGLAARVRARLAEAGVGATVTEAAGGAILVRAAQP